MKTLIRWSLRLLALLFLLVLLTAALLWWSNRHDDELLPQVKEAMHFEAPTARSMQDNAFFTALAIQAPADADPHAEGERLYAQELQRWIAFLHGKADDAAACHTAHTTGDVNDSAKDLAEDPAADPACRQASPSPAPPLPADWAALQCTVKVPDCLAHYQAHAQAIEAALASHAHWQQRYLSLADFPRYQPVYTPHPGALGHFTALIHSSEMLGMRAALLLADQSDEALSATPEAMQQALQLLAQNARIHRRLIAGGHSLLHAMVLQAMQVRQWRLLNALMRAYPQTLRTHAAQWQTLWDELLAPAPIDAEAALAYEAQTVLMTLNILPPSELFAPPSWRQSLWLRMGAIGYLRNATLNGLWQLFEPARKLAGMPAHSWPAREQLIDPIPTPSPWSVRNFAGQLLLQIWDAEIFIDYLERMHDADGFRRLLHLQWLALREGVRAADMPAWLQASPAELRDPYTQAPMEWDAASTSLGFTGRQRQIQNPDASHHYQLQIKAN